MIEVVLERQHVVHIGYHKAASTWLHRDVFPVASHRHSVCGDPLFAALTRNLETASEAMFSVEALIAAVAERTQQVQRALLIGDESLSGSVWEGSWNWQRNAERLKKALPNAAILIVIRRQDEMLRALYTQYVQEGGTGSLRSFLEGGAPSCCFDAAHLQYDRLIAAYVELFGSSSVRVVPYELLIANPVGFLAELSRFLGSELGNVPFRHVNRSLSSGSTYALRAWNAGFRKSKLNDRPGIVAVPGGRTVRRLMQERVDPVVRRVPRIARPRAHDRHRLLVFAADYADSNRTTQAFVEQDLASLGYPLRGSTQENV